MKRPLFVRLVTGLMITHVVAAEGPDLQTPLPKDGSAIPCGNIAGEYRSVGQSHSSKGVHPVTVFQAMRRQTRPGVDRFRVEVQGADGNRLQVTLSDADGRAIGAVLIEGHCRDGTWQRSYRYDGGGEGARLAGDRVWRYVRAPDGVLEIEFHETGQTYYIPGIPIPREAKDVSRFPPYQ